jgi:hypothetical protein
MKKVIDGKLYNTDTATEISMASYGYGNDLDAWDETLYVTKNGAFFIYGSGGPASKYGRSERQNSMSGGSELRVVSKEDALEWCEKYVDDADEYRDYFDCIEEA